MAQKINQNKLAKEIAEREGGKEKLSIAQIKEVLHITLDLLAEKQPSAIMELLERHGH